MAELNSTTQLDASKFHTAVLSDTHFTRVTHELTVSEIHGIKTTFTKAGATLFRTSDEAAKLDRYIHYSLEFNQYLDGLNKGVIGDKSGFEEGEQNELRKRIGGGIEA